MDTQTMTTTGTTATGRYPRMIDNGEGELLTFLGVRPTPTVARCSRSKTEVQPGSGPPMHAHHLQEESLTVKEGRIGYRIAGGPDRFAGPGETDHVRPRPDASLLERRRRGVALLGIGQSPRQPRVLPHRSVRIDASRRGPPQPVRRGVPARPLPDRVRPRRHPRARPRAGVPDPARRGPTPGPRSTLRERTPADQPLSSAGRPPGQPLSRRGPPRRGRCPA